MLSSGRKRAEWRNPVVLLDGLVAGLAVTSIGAVIFIDPIARATTGTRAAIITNMAYPILDLLLLAVALTMAGLSGWHLRKDRPLCHEPSDVAIWRKATFRLATLATFPPQPEGHTRSDLGLHRGDERDRTVDLLLAKQALCQLSYVPENWLR